jgi:hypothetical protein
MAADFGSCRTWFFWPRSSCILYVASFGRRLGFGVAPSPSRVTRFTKCLGRAVYRAECERLIDGAVGYRPDAWPAHAAAQLSNTAQDIRIRVRVTVTRFDPMIRSMRPAQSAALPQFVVGCQCERCFRATCRKEKIPRLRLTQTNG